MRKEDPPIDDGRSKEMEKKVKSPADRLRNIVYNEALIETRPSLDGINEDSVKNCEDGAIYYGTGLCTATALSLALPFDTLSLVLTAERIRRELGMAQVYHHIADTHAKSNQIFLPEDVDRQAKMVKETVLRLAHNLGLSQFKVILASEFDQTSEYLDIYHHVDTARHDYVRREVADIEWYRRNKGALIKLGWIIQASETGLGHDERVFDREYKDLLNGDISFLYLKAGRTLDRQRPKASPYIHIPEESRLLLVKGDDIRKKMFEAATRLGDNKLLGARGYYLDIVRLYERLFGPLKEAKDPEEKIEMIVEKATSG
jgi:hypothetical protein